MIPVITGASGAVVSASAGVLPEVGALTLPPASVAVALISALAPIEPAGNVML